MTLLKNGITDLNTSEEAELDIVANDLAGVAEQCSGPWISMRIPTYRMRRRGSPRVVWYAVASQYYFPKGEDTSVYRYWFPPDGAGAVANDCMGVVRNAENPVLAHHFIDYLLDNEVATRNFGWNGYRPPQVNLKPSKMVADGYVPDQLRNTSTLTSSFNRGFMEMELSPEADDSWHRVWEEFETSA